MAEFYTNGTTPLVTDPVRVIEVKILNALNGGAGGGSGSGGVPSGTWEGSGSPVGTVTPAFKGQPYYDTTGNAYWVSTGTTNTNWQQLI